MYYTYRRAAFVPFYTGRSYSSYRSRCASWHCVITKSIL